MSEETSDDTLFAFEEERVHRLWACQFLDHFWQSPFYQSTSDSPRPWRFVRARQVKTVVIILEQSNNIEAFFRFYTHESTILSHLMLFCIPAYYTASIIALSAFGHARHYLVASMSIIPRYASVHHYHSSPARTWPLSFLKGLSLFIRV